MPTLCAIGYHEPGGTRMWTLTEGLQAHGIRLVECRTARAGFLPKLVDLWKQARRTPCDAILVTFPGQYLMPLGWLLGRWKKVPVVFDAFISLYDTMVTDRGKVRSGSLRAWWLRMVDRLSCLLADRILLDTPEHAAFFSQSFGIAQERIIVVPVGYRADILRPTPQPQRRSGEHLHIVFCGSFIPLQGIDTILRAMATLQTERLPVTLDIVGAGQTLGEMQALARTLGLQNTVFHPPRSLADVAALLRDAHCGLGIFGTTPKAQRVIPHKAYDVLASGRPLITADTPASRRLLTHGTHALLTPMGDPESLARALRTLLTDPALCARLGEAGAALIHDRFSPAMITTELAAWLRQNRTHS